MMDPPPHNAELGALNFIFAELAAWLIAASEAEGVDACAPHPPVATALVRCRRNARWHCVTAAGLGNILGGVAAIWGTGLLNHCHDCIAWPRWQ